MGLKEDFDAAAAEAKKLPNGVNNDEKLALYALFKQANEGDCNTAQPGIFDPTGRAKWSAWNGKKGLSKDDAMKQYIELVATLKAKYA